ncbi:hypothetical protein Taro_045177 [Colocasia esculenta]|uniref:Uncharacterized protein n=1 Tax=Colocasia esculenta TaxID=4460 RepID=A0A843WQJ3_COLES|nr:hypothetical protein [Colocasia esculenta]
MLFRCWSVGEVDGIGSEHLHQVSLLSLRLLFCLACFLSFGSSRYDGRYHAQEVWRFHHRGKSSKPGGRCEVAVSYVVLDHKWAEDHARSMRKSRHCKTCTEKNY